MCFGRKLKMKTNNVNEQNAPVPPVFDPNAPDPEWVNWVKAVPRGASRRFGELYTALKTQMGEIGEGGPKKLEQFTYSLLSETSAASKTPLVKGILNTLEPHEQNRPIDDILLEAFKKQDEKIINILNEHFKKTSKPAESKSQETQAPKQQTSHSETPPKTSANNQHDAYKSQQTFIDVAGIGAVFGHRDIVNTGIVGANLNKINESLNTLGFQVPILSKIMGYASLANPYTAGILAALQIGSLFLNKPKGDPQAQRYMQEIQALHAAVAEIRKELHERFDRTDAKIDRLIDEVDQVYFALSSFLRVNHQHVMENIDWTWKSLSNDIHHAEKHTTTLLKAAHFDELNKYKIHINSHQNNEVVGDNDQKLSALKTDLSEMYGNWLKKNLVALYQNDVFTGEAIIPETSLIFLYHSAKNLGLAAQLAHVNQDKLPLVDDWADAVEKYKIGQATVAERYGQSLPQGAYTELYDIALNTLDFISILNAHKIPLFQSLAKQYKEAMSGLRQHFKNHLKETIAHSDRFYSLKTAINNQWIDVASLTGRVNQNTVKHILSHAEAQHMKLPIIIMLAHNAGLLKLKAHEKFSRTAQKTGWKTGVEHKKDHNALFIDYFGFDYQLSVQMQLKDESISLFDLHVSRPGGHWWGYLHKKVDYPTRLKSETAIANQINAQSDATIIGNQVIHSCSVNINVREPLNESFLDAIVDGIIQNKSEGVALSPEVDALYNAAVKSAITDKANGHSSMNKLAEIKQVMLAYADLLRFPEEVVNQISNGIYDDPQVILSNLQIVPVLEQVGSLPNTIENAKFSTLHPRVAQKMRAVLHSLRQFEEVSRLYQYNALVNQWTQYYQEYKNIKTQLFFLNQIHDKNRDLCKEETIAYVQEKLEKIKNKIGGLSETISHSYDLMSQLGFEVTKVEFVEPEIEQTVTDQQIIAFEENKLLDFSVVDTAKLLEDGSDYMNKTPSFTQPGRLRVGKTRRTKSTLGNFFLGIDYEPVREKNGLVYVRPKNNVPEIFKTGTGKSITDRPQFHVSEDAVDVDLMGFEDTDGTHKDILTARMIKSTAEKFDTLAAIEVVMSEADIYDGGYVEVRNILGKIAKITRDPDNYMIIVSKARLDGRTSEEFETQVLAYLKDALKYIDEKKQPELISFIRAMTAKNIFVADPTKPEDRQRYFERQKQFEPQPRIEFDFDHFDKDNTVFDTFVESFNAHQQALEDEVEVHFNDMMDNWGTDSKRLAATVVPTILHYSDEIKQNEALLHRLNNIVGASSTLPGSQECDPLDLSCKVPPRDEEKTKSSWGSFNFPPGANAMPIPEHAPKYTEQINQQLIFAQWLCHVLKPFVPKSWLPGQCPRRLTHEDINELQGLENKNLDLAKRIKSLRKHNIDDRAYFNEYFDSYTKTINIHISTIHRALAKNQVTPNKLTEIQYDVDKMSTKLDELTTAMMEGLTIQTLNPHADYKYDWLRKRWVEKEPEAMCLPEQTYEVLPSSTNTFWGCLYNSATGQNHVPMLNGNTPSQNVLKPF